MKNFNGLSEREVLKLAISLDKYAFGCAIQFHVVIAVRPCRE